MALDYVFRPLQWPITRPRTPADKQRSSPFKTSWDGTLRKIDFEIRKLGATSCVIQIDVTENQIRSDGRLHAQRNTLASDAVILSFKSSKLGPLLMPADALDEMHANLHAIANHLEHLRLSSLYGVGLQGEQYRGWKALPDPRQLTPAMSIEQGAKLISDFVGAGATGAENIVASRDTYRTCYRTAAGKLHPDRGGDPIKWDQLQEAKRVLDAHHGNDGT